MEVIWNIIGTMSRVIFGLGNLIFLSPSASFGRGSTAKPGGGASTNSLPVILARHPIPATRYFPIRLRKGYGGQGRKSMM
jgi:hypothetical protein